MHADCVISTQHCSVQLQSNEAQQTLCCRPRAACSLSYTQRALSPASVQIENVLLRRAAKVKAAYQKSLNPRLLVPAGLGLLVGVANKVGDG